MASLGGRPLLRTNNKAKWQGTYSARKPLLSIQVSILTAPSRTTTNDFLRHGEGQRPRYELAVPCNRASIYKAIGSISYKLHNRPGSKSCTSTRPSHRLYHGWTFSRQEQGRHTILAYGSQANTETLNTVRRGVEVDD
ncbi:hypothetical protein NX059_004548 [Plenodomus lindquistii]|nr:hypothetical protein NX059_004548 [Plenodomus lindquistii]